ncbi:MAG: YIP1 family protein [Bacillota bacterium]|nr:YIP1 family protein [Bacillota bacterium]
MSKNYNLRQVLKSLSCLVLVMVLMCGLISSYAQEPYAGYNYNYYGKASSPNGFLPVKEYYGDEWGTGYLKDPADVYVDSHDFVYILDSGNGRIIKLDKDFNLVKCIDTFKLNGVSSPLNLPQGICVTADGEIYICDTQNSRVIVTDQNGNILRSYGKPNTELIGETVTFLPKKVTVTATGDMYIIADNIVDGALVITQEGKFLGFFATDDVTLTYDSLKVVFWRLIMTEEQIRKMMSLQPVPFDNMYLKGDFLYTATLYERETNQIRKVNPASVNLFSGKYYGESYNNSSGGGYQQAAFIDVNVDDKGFVYCLDRKFCKVFMYNQDSELLMVFGGNEEKLGHFAIPSAIETVGNKVLVLDTNKKTLTVFEPTYYGEQVMKGSYLYDHGKYQEAVDPWKKVLKLNTNYELAYRGIARAEYLMGDYKQAIKHFESGYDRDGYSESRQKLRSQVISDNFTLVMSIILIIIVGLTILGKKKKKILAACHFQTLHETGYAGMKKWKYPFYNLIHPVDGMSEMRYNKKGSRGLACIFAFAWYASVSFMRQYEDYIFNATNKNDINIFMILATTIGLMLIGCLANWAITTLVDGKGTFKNIFIYCSYALIPATVAIFLVTFLSHYMIQTEAVFVKGILLIGYIWTAVLLFIGMQTVHNFATKKAILMVILTAVGMLVIIFLMMLLVVLYSQVATFITTIFYELFYRLAL